MKPLATLALLSGVFFVGPFVAEAETSASLKDLRVEHRLAPVGLDTQMPRFSWKLETDVNGARQTAYQVEVTAGGAQPMTVWDSGWVVSDQSHLVPYAGNPLRSSLDYHWRVRIKDQSGSVSKWSDRSTWVTGLLDAETEFKASWIGFDDAHPHTPKEGSLDFANAAWIYHPDQKKGEAPVIYYRKSLELPPDVTRVLVGMDCTFVGQLFFNGRELLQGGKMGWPSYLDVTPWAKPGDNQLAMRVNENKDRDHPGAIAVLRAERADGQVLTFYSDETWESTLKPVDLWTTEPKDEYGWKPVKVLGKGGAPNPTGQGQDTLVTLKFNDKAISPPAVYLRKEIELGKPIRLAVFHGTAQGLYDLHINGQRITSSGFQPGWTQYEKHTSYVSFDVTDALVEGRNALGAILGDGWFRGQSLWFGRQRFGDKIRFAGQLEVEYTDGSRETLTTDSSWKASFGPILQSDIMNGEIYDSRQELSGWSSPNYADRGWKPVASGEPKFKGLVLRAHPTAPVTPESELMPQSITSPKPGVYLFDYGQNFAGWTRLKINGHPGQSIYLRFGEDIKKDGTLYTDNLRAINPADLYICKGEGTEIWEPRFTYHGFRYVEVHGLKQPPGKDLLTGIVAHSGGPITSAFDSSSPMLNRLYKNIQWSQRSNYFETMTDCPQRDERYGWVGDAWFFMASSAYNQNGASFFTKWFLDCVDTQNGTTGNISNGAPGNSPGAGTAQLDWSAAMMVTPWMIWQRYGDDRPIRENYDAIRFYMTLWENYAKGPKGRGNEKHARLIGDWVAIEMNTPKELIGHALGYVLSRQMADCARIVANEKDEKTFTDLADFYRSKVIADHILPDGTVNEDTQCGYAYISRYRLFNPEQEDAIRMAFSKRMKRADYNVLTGFHGTGQLLPALSEIGLVDEAAKTLLNDQGSGWGSMVRRGATTIWEHWDGKDDAGNFSKDQMNSFNHYTFGGCGEWMMGYLVGLRNETVGFKTIRVEPVVIPDLDYASGSFETPYGTVSNRWTRKGNAIEMTLTVPPNSAALVVLPNGDQRVGSGVHHFHWTEHRHHVAN